MVRIDLDEVDDSYVLYSLGSGEYCHICYFYISVLLDASHHIL